MAPQQAFGSPDGSFRQRATNGDPLVGFGPNLTGGSFHGSNGGMRIGNTGLIQLVNPNTAAVACAPADGGLSDRNMGNGAGSLPSGRVGIPALAIPGAPANIPANTSGLIRLDVNKLSEEERAREFRNRNHDQLGNTPVITKVSGHHTPPAK